MKKSKVFILALTFVFAGTLTAFANNDPKVNTQEIRKEIAELVSEIGVDDMSTDMTRVQVQFIVNSENEIIVMNVNNDEFDGRIKSKLNYKKLNSEATVKNKIYSVPIIFKKK